VDELLRNIRPTEEEISPTHTRELTRRESDAYKDEEEVHSQTCLEKVALLSRSASSGGFSFYLDFVPYCLACLSDTRFIIFSEL